MLGVHSGLSSSSSQRLLVIGGNPPLIQRKAVGPDSPSLGVTEKPMTPVSKPFHQMVWIDHQVARLYGATREDLVELTVIHAADEGRGHVHHKAGTMGPGHVDLRHNYLKDVATALQDARELLIVGPADAKHQLKNYLAANAPILAQRVVGVEPMDKCSAGDLQAFASLFFRQADRMRPASHP
jgi:hypothetical protein